VEAVWHSAVGWYIGDVVGIVGFAPFLLIHLLPWSEGSLALSRKDRPERRPREIKTRQIELGDVLEAIDK